MFAHQRLFDPYLLCRRDICVLYCAMLRPLQVFLTCDVYALTAGRICTWLCLCCWFFYMFYIIIFCSVVFVLCTQYTFFISHKNCAITVLKMWFYCSAWFCRQQLRADWMYRVSQPCKTVRDHSAAPVAHVVPQKPFWWVMTQIFYPLLLSSLYTRVSLFMLLLGLIVFGSIKPGNLAM